MIKITIDGSTPLEALSTLTAFGMHCQSDETVYNAARKILDTQGLPSAQNPQPVADLLPAPAAPVVHAAPAPSVAAPSAPAVSIPAAPAPSTPPAAPAASIPAAPAPSTPPVAPAASIPAAPAAPVAPVVPVASAPTYTREQLGRAGAELISAHQDQMPQFLGLLSSFGVQAVTELRDDQLGPFATALRGMGAKI